MLKSKTFWAGLASIAGGVAIAINGDLEAGFQLVTTGLIGIFIKDAIIKK